MICEILQGEVVTRSRQFVPGLDIQGEGRRRESDLRPRKDGLQLWGVVPFWRLYVLGEYGGVELVKRPDDP
jgi:hypothetical protein